jgi:hypothetical protein
VHYLTTGVFSKPGYSRALVRQCHLQSNSLYRAIHLRYSHSSVRDFRCYVFDELWMALARAEKVAQVEHISRTQRATARFGYRMAKPNRTKLNASFSISKCRLCRLCQCRHGSVDVRTIKLGAGKALIVKGPNSQANRL